VQLQGNTHILAGPHRAFGITESRLQQNGSGSGVDVVVDEREGAVEWQSSSFRRPRAYLKRVSALVVSLDIRQLALRNREANQYPLDLIDDHQRRLAVRLNEIAEANEQAPGSAGDRRADGAVGDVERRLLNRGAVCGDGSRRRYRGRFGLIRLGAGDVPFLDQRRVACRIAPRVGGRRCVTGQLAARLIEYRDVGSRIDLE